MIFRSISSGRTIKKEIVGSLFLTVICIFPFFTFAKGKTLHVDKNYIGVEEGTKSHPFRTISRALDNASESTTVNVEKGTYWENIEIPKGVTVAGSERDEVIIEADDDKPAVKMKHKSHLDEVTVRNGKTGITISEGDKASVSECIIENNDKEGIKIEAADANSKYEAILTDNLIKNNGRNGIFSEKRKLFIRHNEITDNDGDGIGIMPGSKASISGNKIKNNDGSGMRINIDRSNIQTQNNTYRENNREGIEIDSKGESGKIDIGRSKFWNNDRWAIAKIQKSGSITNWEGVTIQSNNAFIQSRTGNISPIIRVN